LIVLWALVGSSALLTHYFLVFVWTACAAWLLLAPGRTGRAATIVAVVLSMAMVVPWYIQTPETLHQWRVTAGWLDIPLSMQQALIAPVSLVWSMIATSDLGYVWDPTSFRVWLVLVPICLACLAAVRPGTPSLFTGRQLLPWLWLAGVVFGLIVFDLLRGTSAAWVPRYALTGVPAAFLVVAMLLSRLPRPAAGLLLLVVLVGWAPEIYRLASQPRHPEYPSIAAYLDTHTTAEDLIIVRSIPSGVLAVTRYMKGDTPVASWVEQLKGASDIEDLDRITIGVCQILVISIHTVTNANTLEPWLHSNASLIAKENIPIEVHHFRRDPPFGLPEQKCRHLPPSSSSHG
jgi:hypothetical protein